MGHPASFPKLFLSWTSVRGSPTTVQWNRTHANPPLRELKNAVLLEEIMGLSMNIVQRMLGASLVASLGVWFLQGAVMDAVLTLIALCALTGVVWISIWAFPTVGAYILSLSFIGSFWVTGYMMQPNGA